MEAGAIFIKLRNPDGTYNLFGPAPQMIYDETKPDERLFMQLKSNAAEMDINDDLEKQKRWDSDLWIVEIEDYRGDRSELFSVVEV
ncbi:hypothetical protein PMI41_03466 [Phyllobacterium sp. YR531]|nr:hypothetical protein PMI41_03466 [Phyllobacterium sp. YR531]